VILQVLLRFVLIGKSQGCRKPQDLAAVQTAMLRETLERVLESSRRLAEASLRVADEAGRVIQSQAGRNAAAVERSMPRRVA